MLDKLRIALVLLVIGAISGTLIWGTHALTNDRIQENRARARLAVYVEMFPDLDVVDGMVFEDISNSAVKQKITMLNAAGTVIGYAFLGTETNAFGFVDVVIGIDASGKIIDVVLTDYDNTDTYVRPLIASYIVNFAGQPLTDVTYDAQTGATQTYNSVRRIIEAAKLLVAGDPVLEAYRTVYPGAVRYEETKTFSAGPVRRQMSVFDEQDALLGYLYVVSMTYEDETIEIGIAIHPDDLFDGIVMFDESARETFKAAIEAFDDFKGLDLEAIDFSVLADEARINQLKDFTEIVLSILLLDDEELARLRGFDFDAARAGETEVPAGERLTETFAIYDESDDFISQVYIGETEGYGVYEYNQPIEMALVIAADGTIKNIIIIKHQETDGLSNVAFENLDILLGKSNTDDYNRDDAYAWATVTGNALRDFIKDALDDFNERVGG